tara:strand:- start:269 stop:523 length:255 start_codon:yes stop_codon:yes gene_type:complete
MQFVSVFSMNYITEKITFRVPQNGGFQYRMYECADQIADLLDMYFDTQIEDISKITDLICGEIKVAQERQFKENQLENINGGSK